MAEGDPSAPRSLAEEIWAVGAESELRRTVQSTEFARLVLPGLVAQVSSGWNGRHVFFLHVPKAAGSAFRNALTEALGIPAIGAYSWVGARRPDELRALSFWPLLVGHAHVDDFPDGHRGVTTFREPRSRLLSRYRWDQRDPRVGPFARLWRDPGQRITRWQVATTMPFERWLVQYGLTQSSFFTSGRPDGVGGALVDMSYREKRQHLERGLRRFDACAWAHDHPGLEQALRTMTGRADVNLNVANVFQGHPHAQRVSIGADERKLLDEFARADDLLFDLAHDGIALPPLDQAEADGIFESTAQRLDFSLD